MIRKKCIPLLFITLLLTMCSGRQGQFPFVIPWDDASDSVTNLGYLLHKPAGRYGHVFVNNDGHLATGDGRIRFWGVSVGFGACFPEHGEAGRIAQHMAKFGINLVRFHHMDMYKSPGGIWKSTEPDREIDQVQMDKLDYFIFQLKENGIYSDINLLVSRPFHPGKELHESIDGIFSEFSERKTFDARKTLLFFSEDINTLKRTFFTQILTHVNPYTGLSYADDPCIAFIEPLNEAGILHSYFSGYIRDLPDHYKEKLAERWNEWMSGNYNSREEIIAAWNPKSFDMSRNLLKIHSFEKSTLDYWKTGNDAELLDFTVEENEGPNSFNVLKIMKKDNRASLVLLYNRVQGLKPGIPYRLFFYIKSDHRILFSVNVNNITPGREGVVYRQKVNVEDFWVRCSSEIFIFKEETDVEFSIVDLSNNMDTIRISHVEFEEAAALKDPEKKLFAGSRINLFNPQDSDFITMNGNRDWFSFLMQLESDYWEREIDFLKNTLGVKCPVVGSMASLTMPSLLSGLDVTCDTQYWAHPSFPGIREWDINDWYVENYPMVNFPETAKTGQLAMKRIAGKPFIVTEYNHPHPNSFEAEAFFFASAYASFQDWDAVIAFSYCQKEKDWGSEKIRNFFDIDQNPVKLASFVPCALQFLRGDLKPAEKTIRVPVTQEKEYEIIGIKSRMWNIFNAGYAGLDPLMSTVHGVEVVPFAPANQDLDASLHPENKNSLVSDTGEIYWDNSKPGKGVFIAESDRSIFLAGFLDGDYRLKDITITPGKTMQQGFCVIALSVAAGASFSDAERIIITTLGMTGNKDEVMYEYPSKKSKYPPVMNGKITLRSKWGTFPAYIEGITAKIVFPCEDDDVTAWALDARGKRNRQVGVKNGKGGAVILLHPRYKTTWYEVEWAE